MSSGFNQLSEDMGIRTNVAIRVVDAVTKEDKGLHVGHNTATNSMLTGIGHYLKGDGILNQGYSMLNNYVPRYISLGTMGLFNQEEDEEGLPAGIGLAEGDEEIRFRDYMLQTPGYGADGYDAYSNNNRKFMGLGPMFKDRPGKDTYDKDGNLIVRPTVNCELISDSFPRSAISYRELVPEFEAELPHTIDVIFTAMISTGALAQFREPGKDYIFITEAGLWSKPDWTGGGENGLLAGYRIAPSDNEHWDMKVPENRRLLKESIIRVGLNQVVQVIWKIQIGSMAQLGGINAMYPEGTPPERRGLFWYKW